MFADERGGHSIECAADVSESDGQRPDSQAGPASSIPAASVSLTLRVETSATLSNSPALLCRPCRPLSGGDPAGQHSFFSIDLARICCRGTRGALLRQRISQEMAPLGSRAAVIQAASRRASLTALLQVGLLAPALVGRGAITSFCVSLLSIGGDLRVSVGGTASEEVVSFALRLLRAGAMLLGNSQGVRVEVAPESLACL